MFASLKYRLITGWNLFRVLRAVLAIFVLTVSIKEEDIILIAAGSFIALQTLLNIGCCGPDGCAVYPKQEKIKKDAGI